MITLFIANTIASPLQVTHDLRPQYLHKKGIVLTIHVHNPTAQEHTIPDLANQTWRTQFILQKPNGKKETRSNEKKAENTHWVLPPKSTRAVTLEIPSSSSLKKGSYVLDLRIDYTLAQ